MSDFIHFLSANLVVDLMLLIVIIMFLNLVIGKMSTAQAKIKMAKESKYWFIMLCLLGYLFLQGYGNFRIGIFNKYPDAFATGVQPQVDSANRPW